MLIAKEKDEKKNSKQNTGSEILEHYQSNTWVFDVPENCDKIEHKKWDKINIWRDKVPFFAKFKRTKILIASVQFSSVQSLSPVWLFVTKWITARQASLSITNSQSSLRLTSIKSVMPSSHLILCHPLLLLPPIPPSIRVFSNESTLRRRWPKYWSFR